MLLMAYSKEEKKSSGDRASPCFRPFWIGKLSDILISLTSFMGTPNPIRILYKTSLLTES
jgi:hypothetical protein